MNVLTLVQKFCARTGIPSPSQAIGSTDPQVVQLCGLLEEVIEDLTSRATWSALVQEALFTTANGEDQGLITTLAPNGFKWVIEDTIYNRTLRLPVYGPITAGKWQALKSLPNSGPFYKYRIVRGRLLMNPPAAAGHQCAFEYASKYCVTSADGLTYKDYPTTDTDVFLCEDTLLLAGLRWKWKYEKGLEYAEDFRRFEEMVNNSKSRDGTKPELSMDGAVTTAQPGVFVPSGNWNLP